MYYTKRDFGCQMSQGQHIESVIIVFVIFHVFKEFLYKYEIVHALLLDCIFEFYLTKKSFIDN